MDMILKVHDIEMNLDITGIGKPILLLHGLGLDKSIWHKSADYYQDQAQFILPDLRGHGRTSLGNADGTIEQFAEDINSLLDTLRIKKVILGGHSMGGYIALAFAEKHPERLAGLVMVATNADKDTAQKRAERLETAKAVLTDGGQILAKTLAPRLSGDDLIVTAMQKIISATDARGLYNVQTAIANRPARMDVLTQLDCPVLVIAGKADKIGSLEASNEMAESAKNGHFVALPGVGHMPMLEAPETLGALLVAF